MTITTSAVAPGADRRRRGWRGALVWLAILTLLTVLVPIGTAGASDDTVRVNVYFTPGGSECDVVATFSRDVEGPAVLTGALEELLKGPTVEEKASLPLATGFSSETAGMLRSVSLRDGTARVDFADLREVLPNASTSCGSTSLLSQLDATATQFPTVDTARYSINGSEATFYEWLGRGVPDLAPVGGTRSTLTNRSAVRRTEGAEATLRRIRAARHDGYDRVVFEFYGGRPAYNIHYAAVARQGGSGRPIATSAVTALQIDLQARTVFLDDPGFPRSFSPSSLTPKLPTLRTVRYGGQFEGQSTFGAGVRGRTGFRVIELANPTRIVIDVRHGARVRTLRRGMRGADVREWKIQLNTVQHGFFASSVRPTTDPLPTGGYFGWNARRATRTLQRAEGVTVTGTVDAATRRAMRRALYRSSRISP
jgi:peptidoglycan hydrolase-like protein with peptidoglycan-binding domain